MFKMAERSDGYSGETLLAPCTRKKRLQRKMTKDNYWIGVQENIGMFKLVFDKFDCIFIVNNLDLKCKKLKTAFYSVKRFLYTGV